MTIHSLSQVVKFNTPKVMIVENSPYGQTVMVSYGFIQSADTKEILHVENPDFDWPTIRTKRIFRDAGHFEKQSRLLLTGL